LTITRLTIKEQEGIMWLMETKTGPDKQEHKYPEGTFGRLVEDFDPLTAVINSGRSVLSQDRDNPKKIREFKDIFSNHFKCHLLALCTQPEIQVSPEQKDVIRTYLYKIFQFPLDTKNTLEWIKADEEKELILATYINSLSK
jgi:hypothetical protein